MGAHDTLVRSLLAGGSAAAPPDWSAWLGSLPTPAWIVDGDDLTVCAANAAAHALLGWPAGALVGQPADAVLATPEDLAYWADAAQGVAGALHSESVAATRDGRALKVVRHVRPFVHDGGHFYTVSLSDLTELRQSEERLEQALAELQATLESTGDGILVTDLGGRIRAFNRRFARMWSIPGTLLEQRDDAAVHEWLRRSVDGTAAYDSRLQSLVHAPLAAATDRLQLRSRKVFERVAQPLWFRGQPMGRVYSFRDLTERLAADRRVAELARTDTLTGLPNRAEMAAVAERAARAAGSCGGSFALMLVDLDRFGAVNEILGSSSGDRVLLEVARRLRGALRQRDVVGRVGGDQFALLLHDADAKAAEIAVWRVMAAVAEPTQVDGLQFTLTCSIGIALCPAHGERLDELLGSAEEAVRRARAAGRGRWRLYSLARPSDARADLRMDHAMRQALAADDFRLHFQPQVDAASGAIVGAECLLRWHHADFGGDVSPARFIPVAENSGLIVELGAWVLDRAVRQASSWLRAGLAVPVAVNVSALQFQQPGFVEQVDAVLRRHALPAQWLELEVTESILVHDAEDGLARLNALARLGVRLSIDDFGTGYSSLAYLKRLPIQMVKIDRSFVCELPGSASDAGIVTAVVRMAQALNLEVVAEGVERADQLHFLREAGCARYQGFLFSPAVDASRFEHRWRLQEPALEAPMS